MKKLTSALVACTCAAVLLSGCSEAAESESSQKEKRISTNPINEELLGTWMNGENGYKFQDDRKVSLIMDFSEDICFNSDGSLHTVAAEIPPEEISFDGSTLSVSHLYEGDEEPMELFTLVRKEGADSSTFDGEYNVVSGEFISVISAKMDTPSENIDLDADITDGAFVFSVTGYCDYETSKDQLDMFSEYWTNNQTISYSFEINGNELTLTYLALNNKIPVVFTRVEGE